MLRAAFLLAVGAVCAAAQVFLHIPFTARQGLAAAQQAAGTTVQPCTIYGAVDLEGRSQRWTYVFPAADSLVVVDVVQLDTGVFLAERKPLPADTTVLVPSQWQEGSPPFDGLYYSGTPLEPGWTDSDSMFALVRKDWVHYDFFADPYSPYSVYANYMGLGRYKGTWLWEYAPPPRPSKGATVWLLASIPLKPLWCYTLPFCYCDLAAEEPKAECGAMIASVNGHTSSQPELTPNPAIAVVAIRSTAPIESVELYSITGRAQPARYTPTGDGGVLDVRALPSGCYVVRIRSGSAVHTQLLHVVR